MFFKERNILSAVSTKKILEENKSTEEAHIVRVYDELIANQPELQEMLEEVKDKHLSNINNTFGSLIDSTAERINTCPHIIIYTNKFLDNNDPNEYKACCLCCKKFVDVNSIDFGLCANKICLNNVDFETIVMNISEISKIIYEIIKTNYASTLDEITYAIESFLVEQKGQSRVLF